MLDLESEVQGFNTHWGNILLLEFLFSRSKVSGTNIGIIANYGSFEKPLMSGTYRLSAYYLSKTISEIPVALVHPTLHLSLTYFLVGLTIQPDNFVILLFTLYTIAFTSQVRTLCNSQNEDISVSSGSIADRCFYNLDEIDNIGIHY